MHNKRTSYLFGGINQCSNLNLCHYYVNVECHDFYLPHIQCVRILFTTI